MSLVVEILVAWVVAVPALVLGYAALAPRWLERRLVGRMSSGTVLELRATAPRHARSA
jgi:hypothetical protein